MEITIGKVIVWIIVGGFAGSVVGAIVKGKKEGYGKWKNLGIGLVGALVGGVLFNLFGIDIPGLGDLQITGEDLVSALLGSVLLLVGLSLLGKARAGKKKKSPST